MLDLFLSEYKGPQADRALVEKSWPLEEIDGKYQEFISTYSNKYIIHQSLMNNGQMTDAECFVERTNLVHEYRKFLFVDPGLTERVAAGNMERQSCCSFV